MRARVNLGLAAGAVLAVSGCGTGNNFVDDAIGSAADSMGQQVGKAAGDAAVRHYSPMFMRWQTAYLMRMAFYAEGHSVEAAAHPYEPGEYTEWEVSDQDEEIASHLRRAFLFENDDDNKWWQVVHDAVDAEEEVTLEALFTPDRSRMLRLRAEYPDGEGPREMPVEEQNYRAPQRLTEESIEGATEDTVSVTVPAGTFEARKVRFSQPGGGTQTWWLSDDVPGGVVKYSWTAPRDEEDEAPEGAEDMPTSAYIVELQDYGSGAESRLGIEP
ncbi:MAG: hypothetical protein ACLFVF_04265 [Thiohalospira sp.]